MPKTKKEERIPRGGEIPLDFGWQEGDPTEWTVMAYLAGDNNLNEEMVLTLQEIQDPSEKAPDTIWPRVKILSQLDPSGLGLPTQRFVFDTKATIGADPAQRYYLQDYEVDPPTAFSDSNTGNPNALSGFVDWSAHDGPHQAVADRYALILSGHGSGSTEDFLAKDESAMDSLTIPELATALDQVNQYLGKGQQGGRKKIDVFGMDCCFMSMLEVYYQIRSFAQYVVAAESMIPDFGWPYHRILARAEKLRHSATHSGAVKADELAEIMVYEFIEYYSDYDRTAGRSVDLAAIKLDKVEAVANGTTDLAAALHSALESKICTDQIHLAHLESQTYKFDQFVDLRDFCLQLKDRFSNSQLAGPENEERVEGVQAACKDLLPLIENSVLLSGCSGFAYQHSYGLSVYLPWAVDKVSDAYRALAFNADFTNDDQITWADFIDKYLQKTKRDSRDGMEDAGTCDSVQAEAVGKAIQAILDTKPYNETTSSAHTAYMAARPIPRPAGSFRESIWMRRSRVASGDSMRIPK